MIFKQIMKRITQKINLATAAEVQAELNNFLLEAGLSLLKTDKIYFNSSGSYTALGAKIASIKIDSAGTGYAAGTISFSGGVGTEAVGVYTVDGDGKVTAINFSYYGNYTTKPTSITLSDPGSGGSGFSGTIVWDSLVVVTSVEHGIENGDTANLVNDTGADLDESYEISNITDNTFDIVADWTETGTGSWTSLEETDELDIPENIETIKQIYLNDEKLDILRTRKNIVEGELTDNSSGCFISEDRKIMFPANLESTDTLYCIAYIVPDEIVSLLPDTVIDIDSVYLVALIDYILKELYLNSKHFNELMAAKYANEYDKALFKAEAALQSGGLKLNLGVYDFGTDSSDSMPTTSDY